MELLSALIGALLLFVLQNKLYHRYWSKRLFIELHFSKEFAIEGEEMSLIEVITNRKILPLPLLQVKFMTSRNLAFKDRDNSMVSDNYYRNDMVSIMMYQKLTKTLTFECKQRGYYIIDRLDIVSSNLFMTHEEVKTFELNLNLYVYPKPIDFTRFDAAFSKMLGTILTKRFINEDPFEFNNIREYQSYDSLKSVNWKASAKTGTMKVNVHDYTSSQQVKVLINTEAETIWKYDDLNEESIRIASALAQQFISQGIPVTICTNARDIITKEVITVPAGSGSNHVRTIQEALSRIDLILEPPAFYPLAQGWLCNTSDSDFIIIISYYQKEDLQELMMTQKILKKDFAWIIPINKEVKVTLGEELEDRIITWETEE